MNMAPIDWLILVGMLALMVGGGGWNYQRDGR